MTLLQAIPKTGSDCFFKCLRIHQGILMLYLPLAHVRDSLQSVDEESCCCGGFLAQLQNSMTHGLHDFTGHITGFPHRNHGFWDPLDAGLLHLTRTWLSSTVIVFLYLVSDPKMYWSLGRYEETVMCMAGLCVHVWVSWNMDSKKMRKVMAFIWAIRAILYNHPQILPPHHRPHPHGGNSPK